MKRIAGLLSAAVIAAVSGAALAQAPTGATETNADMARQAQPTPGGATKAERQQARKKRLAGPEKAPESNADMGRDAQGKPGGATKAQRQQARKKRLAGPEKAPETNADMGRAAQKP